MGFHGSKSEGMLFEYKRIQILGILKKNRTKHVADFEKATRIYKKDIITACLALIKKVKSGRNHPTGVNLTQPRSYEASYDQAIRMLELAVKDTIELDGETFGKYVMDKWDWSDNFNATTSIYNSKRG